MLTTLLLTYVLRRQMSAAASNKCLYTFQISDRQICVHVLDISQATVWVSIRQMSASYKLLFQTNLCVRQTSALVSDKYLCLLQTSIICLKSEATYPVLLWDSVNPWQRNFNISLIVRWTTCQLIQNKFIDSVVYISILKRSFQYLLWNFLKISAPHWAQPIHRR